MQEISGKTNQNLTLIRTIRSNRSSNLILIEGVRLARETLRTGIGITKSFFSKGFVERAENEEIISELSRRSEMFVVSSKLFDSVAETKSSQGIILLCSRPETSEAILERAVLEKDAKTPVILCLHKIANPSNLGAIFRVAEAADICGIVITKNSADPFSPKANRAAMGSNLRLPVWSDLDFEGLIGRAREKGLVITCADADAPASYLETDWNRPRLLVFGSEAHGLSAEERALMDECVSIPMGNGVESLNIAVSCGVILFEASRNRPG